MTDQIEEFMKQVLSGFEVSGQRVAQLEEMLNSHFKGMESFHLALLAMKSELEKQRKDIDEIKSDIRLIVETLKEGPRH